MSIHKNCANYTCALCKDAGRNKINGPKAIKRMTFQLIFEAITDISCMFAYAFKIDRNTFDITYTLQYIAKLTSQIQTVVQVSHNEPNLGLMQALTTLTWDSYMTTL